MAKIVEIEGATLAYTIEGPADAPVVMFANSLAADMQMWDGNVPAFAERYRVLRYDMRGHGKSPAPAGDYTAALLADDVVKLLDGLSIDQVHFVGLSLGGIVGQQLGARYGERLLSLTLCDTMSEQAAPAAWNDRIVAVRNAGMKVVVEGTIERWFTPSFIEKNREQVDRVKQMILRTSPDGYANCAAAVRELRQTELLSRIDGRTLVLTGDQDTAAPPALARKMHEEIRGSRLHVVKDAAHLPNIEQRVDFNGAVLRFIAGE